MGLRSRCPQLVRAFFRWAGPGPSSSSASRFGDEFPRRRSNSAHDRPDSSLTAPSAPGSLFGGSHVATLHLLRRRLVRGLASWWPDLTVGRIVFEMIVSLSVVGLVQGRAAGLIARTDLVVSAE